MTGRPAVFLDRDGTLNVEVDYLADPARFELLPGAGEGLARLSRAGFALVVVTNQSGVARGLLDEVILERIHDRMASELAAHGVVLDLVLYCPYHPTEGSAAFRADCYGRKPKPGMLLEAAGRLNLDLDASWCIGDSLRDLEAGAAVGARGVLVRTGKGAAQESALDQVPGAVVVDGLSDAAELILEAW